MTDFRREGNYRLSLRDTQGRDVVNGGGDRHAMQTPGDWRIGYGNSNFLVAEGPGYSINLGLELFENLVSGAMDWNGK